jgi:threonine/homoserine/homoserine lactone efflux protein
MIVDTSVFAATLAPIALYAAGLPMPGPGFVIVTRTSVRHGAANGAAAALGTTISVLFYAAATLAGISALLATLPWLTIAMQIAGGLYLAYLGCTMVRSGLIARADAKSIETPSAVAPESPFASFRRALVIGFGNPKLAAFFLGLFSPAIGPSMPVSARLIVLLGIFAIDLAYHQLLAQLASRGRGLVGRFGRWAGIVFGGGVAMLGVGIAARALARR